MFENSKVIFSRHLLLTLICTVSLPMLLLTGLLGVHATTTEAAPAQALVLLPGSVPSQVMEAQLIGRHVDMPGSEGQLTIGVVLQVNHQDEMTDLLQSLYDPNSPLFHHWLATGEFDARFGPTAAQMVSVQAFLRQSGLRLLPQEAGPFLVEAAGTFSQVESAFHIAINDYRMPNGATFYANSTDVQVPANLEGTVAGVVGLSDVAVASPEIQRSSAVQQPRYGAGPQGSGLVPSQIAGIYDATSVYNRLHDEGQGETLGLFELSDYKHSDIPVFERQFGLPDVTITNIKVAGGAKNDKGADEVEPDIEMQIALSSKATRFLVYNAPNTNLGDTAEYFKIAYDNLADTISTSWGLCEPQSPSILIQSENVSFEQMAMQGQSMFAASGDDGAFDCSAKSKGGLQVDDPASQPYMTAAGGTSFAGTFDPGKNLNPHYPTGDEHVWNSGCNPQGCEAGASGGGNSRIWARPNFQSGPGVDEPGYSKSGLWCQQQAGVPCREVPDVSVDADPHSGYATYCTDPGDSFCNSSPPWTPFGGTSASSPVWASIVALMDSYQHERLGLFSAFAYQYDTPNGYQHQFHDITQGDNGHYPAGSDYDMTTGIGSPDIYFLVKSGT
jgi:subtilase family serine protease